MSESWPVSPAVTDKFTTSLGVEYEYKGSSIWKRTGTKFDALLMPNTWLNTTTFTYTGADQSFTVPNDAVAVRFRVWGADGGNISWSGVGGLSGGYGGWATGSFFVGSTQLISAGDVLRVMAGMYPGANASTDGYGFSYISDSSPTRGGAGGGLGGVFLPGGAITAADRANAIVIGGGGGGSGASNGTSLWARGGGGGNSFSGQNVGSMEGDRTIPAGGGSFAGGPGAGYDGGVISTEATRLATMDFPNNSNAFVFPGALNNSEGGSSFVHGDAIDPDMIGSTPDVFTDSGSNKANSSGSGYPGTNTHATIYVDWDTA